MNILFIATTGVHQALIAANLHMQTQNTEDFIKLPHFGDADLEEFGKPLYLGNDLEGNRVFTLGVGPDIGMVKKCLEQLRAILGAPEMDLQLVQVDIKSQRLIWVLHQVSRSPVLKSFGQSLINYLLKRDWTLINEQLKLGIAGKTAE